MFVLKIKCDLSFETYHAGTSCKIQSITNLSGRHAKLFKICYLVCIKFSHNQVILLSHCVSMGVNIGVVKFSNETIFQAHPDLVFVRLLRVSNFYCFVSLYQRTFLC